MLRKQKKEKSSQKKMKRENKVLVGGFATLHRKQILTPKGLRTTTFGGTRQRLSTQPKAQWKSELLVGTIDGYPAGNARDNQKKGRTIFRKEKNNTQA